MLKNKYIVFIFIVTIFFTLLFLFRASDQISESELNELLTDLHHIKCDSHQALIVVNKNQDKVNASVFAVEKTTDKWSVVFGPLDASIGKNGFASPELKREGDGKTPSGIFELRTVFGYASSLITRMPYTQVTENDLWIDDIHSADYNHMVRRGKTTASSYEEMRRKDDLYKYGIVVEYNTKPVVQGLGSAIFFHVYQSKGIPTAGCIALSEKNMLKLIQWLDPQKKPISILGTNTMIRDFLK